MGALRSCFIAMLVLIAGAASSAEARKEVIMEAVAFQPGTLTVKQGETVVWRNRDAFPHNVTADGGAFKSGEIPVGGSWSYRARQKGEFAYTCTIHPTMKGRLIVK